MIILTDSRIESRWNWDSQSKPAVCFNGFRVAGAKQYRSSKHSNDRLKAHQDLIGIPLTPQLHLLRLTSRIPWHISMPIRQAAVERFSPIHF
jgi:hypothetical protein